MDARVIRLEDDMKEVKATLGRMEPVLARISERMDHMATTEALAAVRGDIVVLGEKIAGQDTRLKSVETAVTNVGNKLDAKMVSGGQMFTIFGALLALFFVFGGIAIGILKYLGMLH